MCSIRTGLTPSAQWCDDRQKAVPIARAARRFARRGAKPARNRTDDRAEFHECTPYAARTLTRNSSTALRSMPDWSSSSRAFAIHRTQPCRSPPPPW